MNANLEKINIKSIPFTRLFLSIFLLINIIGIINFPFYKNTLNNDSLYLLVFLGLVGFITGSLLVKILKFKITKSKGRFKPKLFNFIFFSTNIISFLLISYTHFINRGIILLMGDARFTTFAYTNLFIYVAIITSLLYFSNHLLNNNKIGFKQIIFIGIQSMSVISMGYRSPLIMLAGGCVLIFIVIRNDFQNNYKNIFTIPKIIGFLALIIFMSAISSYRVSQNSDVRHFFQNINFEYLDKNPLLKPVMPTLAVFRYDQEVVLKLIRKTKNNPMYGELVASNFITVLPGEQLGARNIIGSIIDARKFPDGKPWSITPTLQGALFVDGGFIIVFFGFLILGFFMEYLRKVMKGKKDSFSIVLYVLFAINSLMIIHTGYFDVLLFILVFILFFLKFVLQRINYSVNLYN